MQTQQNEKPESIAKPKLLLLSFVFLCIQLALAIALLILLAVMSYFGFQFPNISHQISYDESTVRTDQYITLKYGSNTRYYVSVGFVASCVSLLFALILFIAFLKVFITTRKIVKSDDHRLLKATKVRVLSLFIGVGMTRFIYIIQSFVFGGSIIVFGVYFNFLVQFPFSCSFVYNSEQILAITCVSGALLLISMIAWFLIVCLATDVQNQLFSDDDWAPVVIKKKSDLMNVDREQTYEDLKEEKREKQYENKFAEYSHYKKNEQQSKEVLKKTEQQKQEPSKESKYIFNRTQSPKYQPKHNTHYQYQNKDPQFYDQYREDKPLDNPNKYWQSPSRFNNKNNSQSPSNTNNKHSIFRSRKYLYESPYQQIEDNSYHRPTRSPVQNSRRGRDLLFEEEEVERAQKKSYNAESHRYVEDRQNRHIEENYNKRQISHSNFEQNQDKNSFKNSYSHSNNHSQNTYFKDSKSNQNLRNTPNTPKRRRGILNDYIRGKYVE